MTAIVKAYKVCAYLLRKWVQIPVYIIAAYFLTTYNQAHATGKPGPFLLMHFMFTVAIATVIPLLHILYTIVKDEVLEAIRNVE